MTEYTTPLCKTGEGSHREQWPVMLICTLMFAAAALWFFIDSLHSVLLMLFSLPFIVACCYFSIGGFLEMQRLLSEARITDRGLTVLRPLSPPQTLGWSDLQQVCICLYNRRMGEIHGQGHPQLCFVCQGEQRSIYDRWKTHSPFHHRRLIAIDYDEEILEAVRALCPMEIIDLRDTPPYK